MKKIFSLLCLSLLVGCNAAGSGVAPQPNSVTAVATDINGNYTATSAIRNNVFGQASGVNLINDDNQVWLLSTNNYTANDYQAWQQYGVLPQNVIPSQIAVNSSGFLFVGSTNGIVYSYASNAWQDVTSTSENSKILTMSLSSGNNIFIGNESGNVWYYTSTTNQWAKLTSSSLGGRVSQLALDSTSAPQYIGVSVESNVYACNFNGSTCGSWKNLTNEAGSQYTDQGSIVNSIAFNQLNGASYGYIGNSRGHIWRAIYQGSLTGFENMTSSKYPGYTDTSPVTSLYVNNSNIVIAGTANGKVFIWTPSSLAWSNITPSGSSRSITAISMISGQTVAISNNQGKIWSVTWNE